MQNAIESTLDLAGGLVPTRIKNAWEQGKLQGEIANILPIMSHPDANKEEIANQIATFTRLSEQIPQSEEAKKLNEEGVLWAFKNPVQGAKALGEVIISSLAGQLKAAERTTPAAVAIGAGAGSVVPGIGTLAGAVSGLTAGQILAGMNVESSSTFLQTIKDAGFPLNDEVKLAEAFSDKKLIDKARDLGIKRGVPIAIFDLLTAGIAGRLGASQTLGKVAKISAVAGLETAGGSAGEFAAQVTAGQEIDPNAIALEGIAELGSGAPALASEYTGAVMERKKTSSSNVNIVKQIASDKETGAVEVKQNLDRNLEEGIISPEEHQEGVEFADKVIATDEKIPAKVEGENREKSIELVSEKENAVTELEDLKAEKKKTDSAYHEPIDGKIARREEKIAGIDKELKELAKTPKIEEPVTPEPAKEPTPAEIEAEVTPEVPPEVPISEKEVTGEVVPTPGEVTVGTPEENGARVEGISPAAPKSDTNESADHKATILTKIRKEFNGKGISHEQIDGAIALMEARAKSWSSEQGGRNSDDWYQRIADVRNGEFESSDIQYQAPATAVEHIIKTKDSAFTADGILTPADLNKRPTVKITDNRVIDQSSGLKLTDKNKKGSKADIGLVRQITLEANRAGVDPYTMLSLALQETGLTKEWLDNPFHFSNSKADNVIRESIEFFKSKLKLADSKGKKTEADKIQAWNGYGKISPKSEYNSNVYYGINVSKTPLDMSKNPVYGKRIIDLRENVIKKNPEIVKAVEAERKNIAFQDNKGALETLADGRVVIHALESPDFSTMVHEIFHVFEADLNGTEKQQVKDFGGSEAFARAGERYLRDGKAPSEELKPLFEKFKKWLTDIYQSLKGSPVEKKVSPEIKEIFERLLMAKTTPTTTKKTVKEPEQENKVIVLEVPAGSNFEIFENEGEFTSTTKTYKGRETGNFVYPFLDKKQAKEYDKLRGNSDGVFGTEQEAQERLNALVEFENNNKEAFDKAKKAIDDIPAPKEAPTKEEAKAAYQKAQEILGNKPAAAKEPTLKAGDKVSFTNQLKEADTGEIVEIKPDGDYVVLKSNNVKNTMPVEKLTKVEKAGEPAAKEQVDTEHPLTKKQRAIVEENLRNTMLRTPAEQRTLLIELLQKDLDISRVEAEMIANKEYESLKSEPEEPAAAAEEKTPLETAKEKLARAKATLDAKGKTLRIASDPKQDAKDLFEYHKALVDVAKEYIKEGVQDVKAFAKELGETVTKVVQDAWDEATGGEVKTLADFEETEPTQKVSGDFTTLAHKNIQSEEIRETLNNVERETKRELTDEEKEYKRTVRLEAIQHGFDVVEAAKEEFGDDYVSELLTYLDENSRTLSVENKSLITISLELDLERQIAQNPDNLLTLEKQLKLVRDISTKQQRSAAIATGYGILRQIARVGYDINEVTDQFFSPEQKRTKREIIKAIESDADEINKEAERIAGEEQDIEQAISDGVEAQINAIYLNLPTARRKRADKAIAALDRIQKRLRANTYESTIGVPVAIIDAGISTIKQAIRVGVNIADAIELGIKKIKDTYGKAWAKEDAFRKDMLSEFKKEGIDTTGKSSTPQNRLEEAKERVRDRIAQLEKEITDKRKELALRNKLEPDAELKSLLQQEKALKEIAGQYLTPESLERITESKEKAIVTKLENEIAVLDKQIAEGEKAEREAKKDPLSNGKISQLKAEKEAKLKLLEVIDPDPKEFTRQALIDAGFSREITVKGEKRQILDWKKLAGKEMSVENIQAHVEQALKDKGYSDAQISRMQAAFVAEYKALRESIVDRSLKELERLNTPKDAYQRRSSARRLAELYDMGLFDKESDTYDYLMNKALGLGDIGQKAFFEAKVLAKALSDLYARKIPEFNIKQAVREINQKITKLLNVVAFNESNRAYKVAKTAAEFMNLSQRAMLQTVKQLIQNPLSGVTQQVFTKLGYSLDGDAKVLVKQRKKLAGVIYNDIVRNGGLFYGEVTTPFVNKSQVEDYINDISDSKVYHTFITWVMGRAFLEGADSMNKAVLTEKYFTNSLIKILTDKSNPNKMSKEAALKFVSEQLTGQNFEESLKEAEKIIQTTNINAGKVILKENAQNTHRLAMDLVKANLLENKALSQESIEASYNAAYKAAGFDIGHETNNPITTMVNAASSFIEQKAEKAIKDKKWNEAAALTFLGILNRNILNPFVGGGTNWVVLGLQKMVITPDAAYYYMTKGKLDVSTPEGMKDLESTLYKNFQSKNTNIRMLIGSVASILTYAVVKGTGADDEYEEWVKKNSWAKKYAELMTPTLFTLMLASKNDKLGSYFATLFNRVEQFDEFKKLKTGFDEFNKGTPASKAKGLGELGNVTGSHIGTPILPYRMIRDLGGIYKGITGKPQSKFDMKNVGFWNGYFNYGLIDYIGLRPDKSFTKDIENFIPKQDEKTVKFLRDNKLNIASNSDKEIVIDGAGTFMNTKQAEKYDKVWSETFYASIRTAQAELGKLGDKDLKKEITQLKNIATDKALQSIGAQSTEMLTINRDDETWVLSKEQVIERVALIKQYKAMSENIITTSQVQTIMREERKTEPQARAIAEKALRSGANTYATDLIYSQEDFKKKAVIKE